MKSNIGKIVPMCRRSCIIISCLLGAFSQAKKNPADINSNSQLAENPPPPYKGDFDTDYT